MSNTVQRLETSVAARPADASFSVLLHGPKRYGLERCEMRDEMVRRLVERDAPGEMTYRNASRQAAEELLRKKYSVNFRLTAKDFEFLRPMFNGDFPPANWYTTEYEFRDIGDRGHRKVAKEPHLNIDTFLDKLFAEPK